MKIKTLIVAVTLAAAPTLAAACPTQEQHAMSCKDGYKWSAETKACVETVTG